MPSLELLDAARCTPEKRNVSCVVEVEEDEILRVSSDGRERKEDSSCTSFPFFFFLLSHRIISLFRHVSFDFLFLSFFVFLLLG